MHAVSQRAWGLRLRGISARTRDSALAGVAFPLHPQGRHPSFTFSKLNTQPTDASCLRFDDGLTTATARLEVRWFATPFLPDSFIPYCMPVYPGARIPGDGPVIPHDSRPPPSEMASTARRCPTSWRSAWSRRATLRNSRCLQPLHPFWPRRGSCGRSPEPQWR